MRPSNVLIANNSVDGIVRLEAYSDAKFEIIGTNLTCIAPLNTSLTSVDLSVNDKNGIIAVYISYPGGNSKANSWHGAYILKVTKDESGKSSINLNDAFISSPACLVHADYECLMIKVGKFIIRSKYPKGFEPQENDFLVPDANLLCQYIMGEVNFSQLLRAAKKHQLEESALQKLSAANAKLREKTEEINRLAQEIIKLNERNALNADLTCKLAEAANNQLFKSHALKMALTPFLEQLDAQKMLGKNIKP